LGAAIVVLVVKAKEAIPKVMIIGGHDSPIFLQELRNLKQIDVVTQTANWKKQIVNKEIRAAVEIPYGFESDLAKQKTTTIRIYDYDGDLKSSLATETIQKYLEAYRSDVLKGTLAANNVPESVLKPFEVTKQNVAPPEKVGGAAFGGR
jgi:sodium transport system permease protein